MRRIRELFFLMLVAGVSVSSCASAPVRTPDAHSAFPTTGVSSSTNLTSPTTSTSDTSVTTVSSSFPSPTTQSASVNAAGSTWWEPRASDTWQVQLSGGLDPSVPAGVYDVDAVDVPSSVLQQVKAQGAHLVCYISARTAEDWRADYPELHSTGALGREMDEWPGEYWLDLGRRSEFLFVMEARIQACADRGFDAVDADNVDGYQAVESGADIGVTFSRADAVAYVRALATSAHHQGLAFGLKNAMDLIPDVADVVDFAVNESCNDLEAAPGVSECELYRPLLDLGRPVVAIDYHPAGDPELCRSAPAGMYVIFKNWDLDAALTTCADLDERG